MIIYKKNSDVISWPVIRIFKQRTAFRKYTIQFFPVMLVALWLRKLNTNKHKIYNQNDY